MPAPVGTRRESGEGALSLLYGADAKGQTPAVTMAELPMQPEEFAAALVAGVGANEAEADDLIRRFSKGWALERMPVIDRTLLRMAIFELVHRPEIPTGAVISEAAPLAKPYSPADPAPL